MSSKESVSIAGRFSSYYSILGNSESFVRVAIFKGNQGYAYDYSSANKI